MRSFRGLEQHGEPINPGWLCPSQGKTSSSAVAHRATTRELGWAVQTFPRLRVSLDCFASHWKALGCKSKAMAVRSPVWILQPCGCGTQVWTWSFSQRGLSLQVILSVLKECCGIEGESPTFCPGQLHPQLTREPLGSEWPEQSLASLHGCSWFRQAWELTLSGVRSGG